MAGSDAQAGFYYQNIVAAQYALDLIEFGSQLRSITLENPHRAKHIDDIIVDRTEGASFIQVKWSEDDTAVFTLHNLVTADDATNFDVLEISAGYDRAVREAVNLALYELVQEHAVDEGALAPLRNRYRFELAHMVLESSQLLSGLRGRLVPVVQVSRSSFRGRHAPDLAAIVPELAKTLGLERHNNDLLGYAVGGQQVVRSIEWQEAFDQGPRLHEPRSSGFILADSVSNQMRQTKSMSPEYAMRRSTIALLEVSLRQVDMAKADPAGRPQKLSERRRGE